MGERADVGGAGWVEPNIGPRASVTQLSTALDHKLGRVVRERGEAFAARVLHWLEALNDEDPPSALAAAQRLERLLSQLDAEGLGRWILTGLRLHPADPDAQRRYFRLEDRRAIEALHGEAGAGELAAAMPSLALLLHGLAGSALQLQPRHQHELDGPPLRPVLTPTHLLLPDDYTVLDGDDRYGLYRAAVAHAVAHLRFSPRSLPAATLKPMSIAIVSAVEDARVERLIARDYPGMRRWFLAPLRRAVQPQGLHFAALVSRLNLALMDEAYEDDNHWVNKARALFDAQAADLDDYAAFRRIASILANDLGQLRVRFNPQRYAVPAPYRDDNSFLWDYGEPATPPPEQELHVQARALELRWRDASEQDDAPAGPQPEIELGRTPYPEWDHRLALHRTDWCTVVDKLPAWPGRPPGAQAQAVPAALPPVALMHSRRLSRTRRLRRQWEGDDIDLNAAVEVLVDQRMRLAPDPRLFMRPGSEDRLASVLVLLDLSESTNDCVGGSMQSILDIEKNAALLLAQSARRSGDRLAVHGFSSNTRAQVDYYRLLDFGAPLDDRAQGLIRSVPGRHSTRIGAALRHATACVAGEPGERRAVLLVTDGEPSDIDVFEPDYLIEDARAAVLEASRRAVRVHAVVLDPKADGYARRIFGWNNYRIVDDAHRLAAHLSMVYARMSAS